MTIELLIRIAALAAVLGTGVVYGTDVFCAMVMRPALARVDDAALVSVIGQVHRYGDRRMPLPAVPGLLAAIVCLVGAAVTAHWTQAVAAGIAVAALLVWLMLYTRMSAPINRRLTAAAVSGATLPDGRALQAKWDSIIDIRAILQAVAVAACGFVLLLPA
jgi:hypothetical protein